MLLVRVVLKRDRLLGVLDHLTKSRLTIVKIKCKAKGFNIYLAQSTRLYMYQKLVFFQLILQNYGLGRGMQAIKKKSNSETI